MPTYSVTWKACQAMVSTKGGMRRILKKPIPTIQYIRQAVESGVYRTQEELEKVRKERRESADDLRDIMRRFRQDIVRGSNIQDYPDEYLILEQHPPIPDPPRTPVKLRKKLQEPPNPVERLTKKYLHRQQKSSSLEHSKGSNNKAPQTTEEYYRRLLGVQAAESKTHMYSNLRQKPAPLQKAYASAVKHYQLQRTEGLTEEEALQRVDEILNEQSKQEKKMSTERAEKAREFRKNTVGPDFRIHHLEHQDEHEVSPELIENSAEKKFDTILKNKEKRSTDDLEKNLSSIFTDNPKAVEGMMRWSERLAAVPYQQWTVGASTAMDHWIARQLLGFSEETWQLLLGGDTDDLSLLSKGRDLIAVREALFPETILESMEKQQMSMQLEEEATLFGGSSTDQTGTTEKNDDNAEIYQLLDSLGGLKQVQDLGEEKNQQPEEVTTVNFSEEEVDDDDADADIDTKIRNIMIKLQMWRKKHAETPYEQWSVEAKNNMNKWVENYVKELAPGNDGIDIAGTRDALLAVPYVEEKDSDDFWSKLQDEGRASALLDSVLEHGPPPGATVLQSAFWDLPRDVLLERLLNLGTLRPLLDELAKETDRLRFLQRHADTILAGVELEHLVSDPDGPISVSDLSQDIVQTLRIHDGDRFRLEVRPYKSTDNNTPVLEKSRALYKAWNELKAGRARYEETLFQTGRLGLRYGDSDD